MLLETIRAGYDAYDAGDHARFRELVRGLLAEDCEIRGPQYEATGPEEILPIWLSFAAAFPDGRHEWLSAVEHPGGVVFEQRYTGTHTAPLAMGDVELPPTGRAISVETAQIVTARDGKVVTWHDYMDSAAFMAQLGVIPAPASAA
jgi:predicted ester cyclase